MTDWTAALGAVSTSLTIVKQLRDLDASMETAVKKAELISLMEKLSEVRMQLLDAREEAREKDATILKLQSFDAESLRHKVFERGFYYDAFEDGSPRGDPYCAHCIDTKRGLYRLQRSTKGGRLDYCPECKNEFHLVSHHRWERDVQE